MASRPARDLEIEEDLAFERRSLAVERAGIAVMLALVAAAVLGLLGPGPLADATARADALALDFSRFTRYQSGHTLTFRLDADATAGAEARLWVARAYLDGARLEAVSPPPVRVEAAPDRLVFVFAVAEPGRPLTVRLALEPGRIGPVHGGAGVEGRAGALTFRQLVFP